MLKKINILVGLLIWYSLNGCSPETDKNTISTIIDIPHDSLFTPYYEIQEDRAKLGLDNITGGYDSVALRLWLYNSVQNPRKVITIKYSKRSWQGNEITYNWFTPKSEGHIIDSARFREIQPHSTWKTFFTEIEELGIKTIKDHNVLKGPTHGLSDGIGYCFELAKENEYRFFHYHCPYYFKDDFKEAFEMTQLLNKFFEEFGIIYSNC